MLSDKELLETVLEVRTKIKKIENDLDLAKQEKLEAEKKFIERMDLTDTKSLKMNTSQGLVGVVRKEILYVSCKKENQSELLIWIDEDCGRPDMIKRVVHNKTLESFVKQRIKSGEAVPSYINFYPKPVLAITKGGA